MISCICGAPRKREGRCSFAILNLLDRVFLFVLNCGLQYEVKLSTSYINHIVDI